MPINYRRLAAARPRIHLLILFFYFITQIVNLLCWILYVRRKRYDTGSAGVAAYMTFVCVGLIVFLFGCAPFIYWPYAYGSEMSPVARRNSLCLAIIVCFFLHDFPIGWMEIWLVWRNGFTEVFQGISLIITMICFAIGFFTTWFSYAWRMSKILQIRFGDAAPSRNSVSAAAVSRVAKATHI